MKQVPPVDIRTPTPRPTPQPTPVSSPQRPVIPHLRSTPASPVRGVPGVTPLPEAVDWQRRFEEQLASARKRKASGSSQGSSAGSTASSVADPVFKTPPPVGRGGVGELLRRQSTQPGFQSPRLPSATISSAAQLEQLEQQTKTMGIRENLDWADRVYLDETVTGENPELESVTNILPTLSKTAPLSIVSVLEDPSLTEEQLMDTGDDTAVQGEAEIPEDILLQDPTQDNQSQNNSSAQVTEDGDKDRPVEYDQSTDVQTVSESSGTEAQPDSDSATEPGDGKT